MKKPFDYSGPAQTLDLREPNEAGDGTEIRDVDFVPGGTVELLPDHPVTIAFQAAGFLSVPADEAPADAAPIVLPEPNTAPQE